MAIEVVLGWPGRASWVWAIVFVGALLFVTAAGIGVGGDHAERTMGSHRVLERGALALAPDGQGSPELRWAPSGRPRFFPAPLVLADSLLGWDRPPRQTAPLPVRQASSGDDDAKPSSYLP